MGTIISRHQSAIFSLHPHCAPRSPRLCVRLDGGAAGQYGTCTAGLAVDRPGSISLRRLWRRAWGTKAGASWGRRKKEREGDRRASPSRHFCSPSRPPMRDFPAARYLAYAGKSRTLEARCKGFLTEMQVRGVASACPTHPPRPTAMFRGLTLSRQRPSPARRSGARCGHSAGPQRSATALHRPPFSWLGL